MDNGLVRKLLKTSAYIHINIARTLDRALYTLLWRFKRFIKSKHRGYSTFSIPHEKLSVYWKNFFAVALFGFTGQILIDEDTFLSNVSFHFRHASLFVLSGCGRQNSPKSDLPRSCNTFCFIISACRSCWAVFDP